jgi:plasmid stabilization system protein ParE
MSFAFHPAAEEEFSAAVDWYEVRQPGLGVDFAVEVRAAIGRAIALPKAWAELEPGIRRVLTQRFPYGVLYSPADLGVFILAVMHLSREPGYWKDRL